MTHDKRDRKRKKPLRSSLKGWRGNKPLKSTVDPRSHMSTDDIDMRHDKYLSAHKRGMRCLAWAISHKGEPFPKEWTAETREKPKPLKHVSAKKQAHEYRGFSDAEFRKHRFDKRRKARKEIAEATMKPYVIPVSKLNFSQECARRQRQFTRSA